MSGAKRTFAVLRQFRFCFNPDHHRLPAYEAAVEALEQLLDDIKGSDAYEPGAVLTMQARTALARLRDEVPA